MTTVQEPFRKLSAAERRALRWQRRIERYEARRSGPPPPRQVHRAVIMVVLMASMLAMLALMFMQPSAPA